MCNASARYSQLWSSCAGIGECMCLCLCLRCFFLHTRCMHEYRESCNIFPECNTVSMCVCVLLCTPCKSQMINIPQNEYIVDYMNCIYLYRYVLCDMHACLQVQGNHWPARNTNAGQHWQKKIEHHNWKSGNKTEWERASEHECVSERISECERIKCEMGPAHTYAVAHTCTTSVCTKTSH